MAYLTLRIKDTEGHSFTDLGKDRMVAGRSSRTEIPIKHTSISREHCVFIKDAEVWYVEDLGSSNGTWLNKDKLTARVVLKERDIVKIGRARLTFHAGARHEGGGDVAVDLSMDEDPHDMPQAPVRVAGQDDPPEAMPCQHCAAWFSFAHRLAGDTMECPRCAKSNTIPSMATA